MDRTVIDLARPTLDKDASTRNDSIGVSLGAEKSPADQGNDGGKSESNTHTHGDLLEQMIEQPLS